MNLRNGGCGKRIRIEVGQNLLWFGSPFFAQPCVDLFRGCGSG